MGQGRKEHEHEWPETHSSRDKGRDTGVSACNKATRVVIVQSCEIKKVEAAWAKFNKTPQLLKSSCSGFDTKPQSTPTHPPTPTKPIVVICVSIHLPGWAP